MKLKKIAAGILAAAMAVTSIPQAVSVHAEAKEYRCQWVDVRPESRTN